MLTEITQVWMGYLHGTSDKRKQGLITSWIFSYKNSIQPKINNAKNPWLHCKSTSYLVNYIKNVKSRVF